MSTLRVKMGEIEVECDGTESFIKDEVPVILEAVARLYAESGAKSKATKQHHTDAKGDDAKGTGADGIRGTTATLAGRLQVKSGNDLIVAAAAHLTFVAGKAEFSRQELLDQVRGATGYFKDSYGKNLTNYISSRVKAGQLMEPRTGHYALGATEADRLRGLLAA